MSRKANLNIWLVVLVLVAALGGRATGRTIYVDPNGSADFTSIQAAIEDANDGDEIEAAPGIYNEAINFNGKAVRLYSSGGPEVTTIDGSGNCHVVQCVSGEDANTVLEGFTITGGHTDDMSPDPNDWYGGGMYCVNSSPTLINCTFTNNWAGGGGGGMCNTNSSPTVTDCNFSDNGGHAGSGMLNMMGSSPTVTDCNFTGNYASSGGGMYNSSFSSPTLTNCTFSNNSSHFGGPGGGMVNHINSSPTLTKCTFIGNFALGIGSGGGMHNSINSSPTLTNCIFTSNQADSGGGMYNCHSGSPTVTNCTFSDNSAESGGGMGNQFGSSPAVINCTFSGNTAGVDGGGIYDDNSRPTVTNCTFSGNFAGSDGGGMLNTWDSSPTVTNCTFSDNTAGDQGGGMRNINSSPTVTNCILWGDTPIEIVDWGTGTTTVSYSDIQGGWGGTGNINADPCFVQSGYWADADDPNIVVEPNSPNSIWIDGDYRLRPGSPCIDAGDNNSVPADMADLDGDGDVNEPIPFDLGGLPRFIDDMCIVDTGNPGTQGPPVVDMGAYEYLPADIDSSGAVDLRDLCIFALHWAETGCGRCGGADLTCDGDVDWNDLRELCDNWLAGTEP